MEVGKGKIRARRLVHEDGVVAAFHIVLVIAAAIGLFFVVDNAVHLLERQVQRAGCLRHAATHHAHAAPIDGALVAALRRARAHGAVERKAAAIGHEHAVDGARRQADVGNARGRIAQRRGGGDIGPLCLGGGKQRRQKQGKGQENGKTALHARTPPFKVLPFRRTRRRRGSQAKRPCAKQGRFYPCAGAGGSGACWER